MATQCIRFVFGSGKDREIVPMAMSGKARHEQRRAFKKHLGLLK